MKRREELNPLLRFFVKKKRNADVQAPPDTKVTAPQPGDQSKPEKKSFLSGLFKRPKKKQAEKTDAAIESAADVKVLTPARLLPEKAKKSEKKKRGWFKRKSTESAERLDEDSVELEGELDPPAPADLPEIAPTSAAIEVSELDDVAADEEKPKRSWFGKRAKAKKQAADDDLDAPVEEEQVQVIDVRSQIDKGLATRFGMQILAIFVLLGGWGAAHFLFVLPLQESGARAARDIDSKQAQLLGAQAQTQGLRKQLINLRETGAEQINLLPDRLQWRSIKNDIESLARRNRVMVDRLQDIPDSSVSPNPERLFGVTVSVREVELTLEAEYFDYLSFRSQLFGQGWPIELRSESVVSVPDQRAQTIRVVLRGRHR